MAFGASRTQVVGLMLWTSTAMVAAGLVLGAAGAWLLGSTVGVYLYEIEPTDVRILAGGLFILGSAALAAGVLPPCRAAMQDPVSVLRPA